MEQIQVVSRRATTLYLQVLNHSNQRVSGVHPQCDVLKPCAGHVRKANISAWSFQLCSAQHGPDSPANRDPCVSRTAPRHPVDRCGIQSPGLAPAAVSIYYGSHSIPVSADCSVTIQLIHVHTVELLQPPLAGHST